VEGEFDAISSFISSLYPRESTLLTTSTHRYRLFGFLAGSVAAGAGVYYYILDEYRLSNEMLTEDIYVRYCI
jgi:hypothetical protein